MDALFTLVRQLAGREPVTVVAAPKWLVQRHGLAAMAARAGAVSYRDDLVRATVDWARIERDIPPLVDRLREAGVRVIPIKGLAYAKALYDSPAERPMGDVDMLVKRADLERARHVLRKLDFAPGPQVALHHAEAWARGDLALDLHSSIIAPGRSRIDLDAVWSRAAAGWPAGAETLEATDAMVFHLAHLVRNRLRLPLMNVVDAARLLERVDTAAVLERARSWGLATAISLALRFCVSILEGRAGRPAGFLGPSREAVALLAEDGVASKVLFDVATAGSPTQLAARVMHFAANQVRRRKGAQ